VKKTMLHEPRRPTPASSPALASLHAPCAKMRTAETRAGPRRKRLTSWIANDPYSRRDLHGNSKKNRWSATPACRHAPC
jgi:hypothetical protein